MKEIKFRAWGKILKRMYSETELSYDGMAIDPNGKGLANISGINNRLNQYDENKRFELMQFTGLLDKNGKEIWEGDILKTPGKFNLEVRIDNIGYGDPKFLNIGFDVCEVIGNIYENPTLLK